MGDPDYRYPHQTSYDFFMWLQSSWRHRLLPRFITKWANRKLNDLIPYREYVRYFECSQFRFDANIEIPDGEHVHYPGLWAVEIIPTSYSNRLSKAITKNKWSSFSSYLMGDDDGAKKLHDARSDGHLHRWRLGRECRKGLAFTGFDFTSVNLPDCFDSVAYWATQAGSSITVVTAYFSLSAKDRDSLDYIWHAPHDPLLVEEPGKRARAYRRMESDKLHTRSERARIHLQARIWLNERCPGFFANRGRCNPIVDCFLFDQLDVAETGIPSEMRDACDALGVSGPMYYESDAYFPGWLVPFDGNVKGDPLDNCLAFVGNVTRIREVREERLRMYGDDSSQSIAHCYSEAIEGYLILSSISKYLTCMLERYSEKRDVAQKAFSKHRPLQVDKLRKSLVSDSLDLRCAKRDYGVVWENRILQAWMGLPNLASRWMNWADGEGRVYSENAFDDMQSFQQKAFEKLLQEDDDYQSLLSTASSLGNGNAVLRVSLVALLVALVSMVTTILSKG